MFRNFLMFLFFNLAISCNKSVQQNLAWQNTNLPLQTQISNENANLNSNSNNSDETEEKYPGIGIDDVFPIIEHHDFMEKEYKEKSYEVKLDEYSLKVKNFRPISLNKNDKSIFKFKTLFSDGYWSNLVGFSKLLGENSRQLYVISNGTGGICCTNYWVIDVSKDKPKLIFQSEDYGGFRGVIEIFDADGDGIYELVRFDSAFRYFMDDCGTCSPEPRAIFKYDQRQGKYLPAKHIQQDFEKENFSRMEKFLSESFEKLQKEEDVSLEMQFNRSLIAHTVNLIWIGEEKKAWQILDKYMTDKAYKTKIIKEIKKRSKESKFYQALQKIK